MILAAAASFLLQLTGCTPYQRIPYTPAAKQQIKSTHMLVNGVQNKLIIHNNNKFHQHSPSPYAPMPEGAIVATPAPAALNGSLASIIVVAVAENHDSKNSNKHVDPILRKNLGFNYTNYFKGVLQSRLSKISWLKLNSAEVRNSVTDNKKELLNQTDSNNLLLVGTTYALNSHMNQLEVTAYLESELRQPNGNPVVNYQNIFTYIYSMGGGDYTLGNEANWLHNNDTLLKSQLRKSAHVLSNLIAHDIRLDKANVAPANAKTVRIYTTHTGGSLEGAKVAAKIIARHGNRYTLLLPSGEIYSVNKPYLSE